MLYFALFTASLGGFLFGYQIAIIAGSIPFIAKVFVLTTFQEGFLVSILLIGALFGSLMAGKLADKLGRKLTIGLSAFIFFIASIASFFASSYDFLSISRFITGIAIGISSVVCPLYIAEISPREKRGSLVSVYQLAIALGILSAYISSYRLSFEGNWRLMFALGGVPAFLQLLGLLWIKDSLKKQEIFKKQRIAIKTLIIGVGLSIFQQITGINAVIYFAPKIFEQAGYTDVSASLYATIGIGIINVFATLVSVWLLDKVGRRPFLLVGSLGMALSLVVLAFAFYTNQLNIDQIAPISLMAYVAFFAIGLGPVVWVVISEIYPLQVRSKAMSIAIFANWSFNYLISLTFLSLIEILSIALTFFLFAAICILCFWFIYKSVPETKGKKLI